MGEHRSMDDVCGFNIIYLFIIRRHCRFKVYGNQRQSNPEAH